MNINVIVSYTDDLIIGNDDSDNPFEWFNNEYLTYFKDIIQKRIIINKKNIVIIGNTTYNKLTIFVNILKNLVESDDIILIVIKNIDDGNEVNERMNQRKYTNGVYSVDSLGTCMELCKDFYNDGSVENIFIVGGESIYTYYLTSYYYKLLNKVYITRIHKKISGNKKFYGLEDKFYYLSIDTWSIDKSYIEHRVLQYDKDFKNGETLFLTFIRKTLQAYEKYGYSIRGSTFEIDIDLTKYFPAFSIIKSNINDIFKQLFASIKKEENLREIHDTLISISLCENDKEYKNNKEYNKENNKKNDKENNKENNKENDKENDNSLILKFNNKNPFNSKYIFYKNDNKLSCNVSHKSGNILNEVIMNIIFSALLIHLFCHLTGLEPDILHYKCIETTYQEKQVYIMEKFAWNTPDVLSIIKIKNRKQKDLEDFCEDDIELLGLNI